MHCRFTYGCQEVAIAKGKHIIIIQVSVSVCTVVCTYLCDVVLAVYFITGVV